VSAAELHLVGPGADQLPFDSPTPAPPAASAAIATRLRRGLADPGPWARAFIPAALETLDGRRPVTQLRTWTSPAVFTAIQRAQARTRPHPGLGVVVVKSVHVSEPAEGVAEVCAVVSRPDVEGPRFRAVAIRLESRSGRWQCVTMQVG